MVGSRRFISFASTAPTLPTCGLILCLLVWESQFAIGREATWVYIACSVIAYPDAKSEDIDLPDFVIPEWCGFEEKKEEL